MDSLANHWCWYKLLATIWKAYSGRCKSKLDELLAGLRVLIEHCCTIGCEGAHDCQHLRFHIRLGYLVMHSDRLFFMLA